MAESKEGRPLREQETLLHATPEQGVAWREGVQEKLQSEAARDVRREREIVAEAVAQEFAEAGAAVSLTHPWEHTAEEHQEVQRLVDLAFAKDLRAALAEARRSPYWPRNLDLFHDVLTTEMYEMVQEQKLNKQPLVGWVIVILGVLLGVGGISVIIFVVAY